MSMNTARCLFTLLLISSSLNAWSSNRVALVIGNSSYKELGKLANPAQDAEAIAKTLKDKGYTLIDKNGQETQNAHLDLSGDEMITAIGLFSQRAASAEIAFFYYAGHGMQLGSKPLLLPVDLPIQSLELIQRHAVDLERDILTPLDGKAQLTVAVFDACRDIPGLMDIMRTAKTRGFASDNYRGLARIGEQGKSRIIAYAGAAGQVVSDDAGQGHSPYTQILLTELDKANWEMGDLFRQVQSQFKNQHEGQSPEVLMQGDVPPDRFFLTDKQDIPKPELKNQQALAQAQAEALHWQQEAQALKEKYQTTPNSVSTARITRSSIEPEMVEIKGGCFLMGSPKSEKAHQPDEKQHEVCVNDFTIGKYEITKAQFKAFVDATDYQTDAEKGDGCWGWTGTEWKTDKRYNWRNMGFEQTDTHPVACVSWNDAMAYISWLNKESHKSYRLPTEAEWEYAARGGSKTAYFWSRHSAPHKNF